MTTYDITNNEQASQFETTVDGITAYAAYELEDPGRIVFTHTVVPEQLSGRGIANQIVKHALEHARSRGLTVVPQCSFVASYVKRHPEYEDLLAR
ncbi:MAG TPA: GNAT family N-acetyltransferase [Thermoanaerobaculia bacterium]|nr:GNAT family N-acetyltransferase [Thermoanaerobaculia bacterium]